jgi:hypothetical protein
MTDSQLIDALGGTGEVAKFFGIAPASVSGWRVNGIPAGRRLTLRYYRPDLFEAKRKKRITA